MIGSRGNSRVVLSVTGSGGDSWTLLGDYEGQSDTGKCSTWPWAVAQFSAEACLCSACILCAPRTGDGVGWNWKMITSLPTKVV